MKITASILILFSILYYFDSNKTKTSEETYAYYYCKYQADVLNVCK